jgi:glycerophosphoryl diester phosphodiesterase
VAIIAHRGLHRREPENSLAAVAEALACGSDGVEIDVRATSDGSLVCFHDWYLKRLTGASGKVAGTHIHQLLELTLRHPESKRRRPIATLAEMLALVEDRVRLILDLKKESIRPSGFERAVVALLREHGLQESVTLSSFNPWVLKRIKQLAPEFATALIASSRLGVKLYHADYCDGLHVHYGLTERRWFRDAAASFPWLVLWTVDRKSDLGTPLADNVRGVITNRPDRWGVTRPRVRRRSLGAGEAGP